MSQQSTNLNHSEEVDKSTAIQLKTQTESVQNTSIVEQSSTSTSSTPTITNNSNGTTTTTEVNVQSNIATNDQVCVNNRFIDTIEDWLYFSSFENLLVILN